MFLKRSIACLFLFAGASLGADRSALQAAFEAHHWFDLRDAVSDSSPLFYRLVSAAAFNDIHNAEKLMSALKRSGADAEQLRGAHYAMYRLYQRNGFYRRAAADARQVFEQSSADWSDMEGMEKLPDTSVASPHQGNVTYISWPGQPYVVVPLQINGHDAQYVMDTGAGMSFTTESEAKRLGLTIVPGTPLFNGITGEGSTQARYAYAARLRIANTELRNVAFTVVPDSAVEVFGTVPEQQRGVIGMPILLAIGSVRWNRKGDAAFGFAPRATKMRDPNIGFDGLVAVTYWEIAKHRLAVELDTGSTVSYVWPRYLLDFPELIPNVPEGKTTLTGATGPHDIRSITLPELRLKAGGFEIVYTNATALLQSTIPAASFLYGLLGKTQLDQAREVSFDFRAMKLTLK